MNISTEVIDSIINQFKDFDSTNFLNPHNLTKFNSNSKEDAMFFSFLTSSNDRYISFLHFLILKLQPKNVVELGNREGLSTLSMYDAIKQGTTRLYSVDIEKDLRYCPDHMFSDEQVTFIFGDVCSAEVIHKLPTEIDVLFTDTLHYDFQLQDEWDVYQHLLADTALVAIDDININDKRKLFDTVTYPKWDLTELCHSSGWGLFLFERKGTVSPEVRQVNIHEAIVRVWERKYNSLYNEYKAMDEKRISKRIKKALKKITFLYNIYVFVFNHVHKKFKGGIVYTKSIRF